MVPTERSSWIRWVLLFIALGSLLLAVAAAYRLRALSRPWTELALVLPGMVVIAGLLWSWRVRPAQARRWFYCVLGLFVASRLIVLIVLPSVPVSDFDAYYQLATRMARGQPLPPPEQVLYFNAWGYPLLLAPWFAAFGPSVGLAKLLNVAAGALACLLLYRLTRPLCGPKAALAVAILFLLWPGQLLLTPVLASEHFALVFCLAFLVLIVRAFRRPGFATGELALAGVLLAAGTAVRPSAAATLACALVLLLAPHKSWRRGILQLALIIAASLVAWLAYQGLLLRVYHQAPPAVGWYNLMVGMNFETRGQYSPDDSHAYFAFPTARERDRFARNTAYQRVSENVTRLPWLLRRKMLLLWGTDHDSVKWSTLSVARSTSSGWVTERVAGFYAWSQYYHLGVLVLGALGAIGLARRRISPLQLVPTLLLLAGTALHAVFEVQPRYHYVFEIGLLVLCSAVFRVFIGRWPRRPSLFQRRRVRPRIVA
jgi:4-amino-4-deoxy-L-arabinose transferase-like glycosyltransferase